MGKIRSSSSKRLHVEEEYQEVEDLSQTHKPKFPILSHEEGVKLTTIKFREIVGFECSYFTKQAFGRGEVVDSSFRFVQARTQSCWHGIACPS